MRVCAHMHERVCYLCVNVPSDAHKRTDPCTPPTPNAFPLASVWPMTYIVGPSAQPATHGPTRAHTQHTQTRKVSWTRFLPFAPLTQCPLEAPAHVHRAHEPAAALLRDRLAVRHPVADRCRSSRRRKAHAHVQRVHSLQREDEHGAEREEGR